jgi:hypothetical protein
MAEKKRVTMATFDGRLMDGLKFCKNVYDMFSQTRNEPNGTSKLRSPKRKKQEKRLTEELFAIARYIQTRYTVGLTMKVRWFADNQPFEAVVLFSGSYVDNKLFLPKVLLEVTRAVHSNEHLVRELLEQGKPCYGVKGAARNPVTGEVESTPYVGHEYEIQTDLAVQIIERLRRKAEKPYPKNTVLIIECIPNAMVFEAEWQTTIAQVRKEQVPHSFCEVFRFCSILAHSAFL